MNKMLKVVSSKPLHFFNLSSDYSSIHSVSIEEQKSSTSALSHMDYMPEH